MSEKLKIGIILGSTREGRVSPQLGEWVKRIADKRGDANYEIVDIAEYNLPFLGTTDPQELHLENVHAMLEDVVAWSGALKTLR